MNKDETEDFLNKARNWTCNQFAITEHSGNWAALMRKTADAIEQLGDISILNIAFQHSTDPGHLEITVSVYYYFNFEA